MYDKCFELFGIWLDNFILRLEWEPYDCPSCIFLVYLKVVSVWKKGRVVLET